MHYLCMVIQDEKSGFIDDMMEPYYEYCISEPHMFQTYAEVMKEAEKLVKRYPEKYSHCTKEELWQIMAEGCMYDFEGNLWSTSNTQGYYDYYTCEPNEYNSVIRLKDTGEYVNSAIFAEVDLSYHDARYEAIPQANTKHILYPFVTTSVVSPGGVWYHDPFEDNDKWYDDYEKNILSKIKPDWKITILDCHI